LPLALYCGWALVSTAWSPLKTVTLGQTVSLITMGCLAAGIVVVDRGEATSRQLLFHLSAAVLTFSTLMLGVVVVGGGINERFGFYLAHPTTVGGAASIGIVLLVASYMLWNWTWTRWMLLPGLAIHGCVVLLALNRTGIIAVAFALGLLLLCYADRLWLAVGGLLASIVFLIAAAVDPSWQWFLSRLESGGGFLAREQSLDQLTEFSGRQELWELIWESFLESPWIGHGYFVTTKEGVLYVWFRETNFNAHNMVLQALASTGILGTVIFLWAMANPALFAAGRLGSGTEVSRRAGLFLLIGAWLTVWGLCDVAVLGPVTPYVIVFFVVLGLLVAATQLPREQRSSLRGEQPA
jgi:O-antigen ligase